MGIFVSVWHWIPCNLDCTGLRLFLIILVQIDNASSKDLVRMENSCLVGDLLVVVVAAVDELFVVRSLSLLLLAN